VYTPGASPKGIRDHAQHVDPFPLLWVPPPSVIRQGRRRTAACQKRRVQLQKPLGIHAGRAGWPNPLVRRGRAADSPLTLGCSAGRPIPSLGVGKGVGGDRSSGNCGWDGGGGVLHGGRGEDLAGLKREVLAGCEEDAEGLLAGWGKANSVRLQ